jgi:hypothetical protein
MQPNLSPKNTRPLQPIAAPLGDTIVADRTFAGRTGAHRLLNNGAAGKD